MSGFNTCYFLALTIIWPASINIKHSKKNPCAFGGLLISMNILPWKEEVYYAYSLRYPRHKIPPIINLTACILSAKLSRHSMVSTTISSMCGCNSGTSDWKIFRVMDEEKTCTSFWRVFHIHDFDKTRP